MLVNACFVSDLYSHVWKFKVVNLSTLEFNQGETYLHRSYTGVSTSREHSLDVGLMTLKIRQRKLLRNVYGQSKTDMCIVESNVADHQT